MIYRNGTFFKNFFAAKLNKHLFVYLVELNIKDALSSLKQFLTAESPLKLMKNVFYFTLKALLILKIFKFLFWDFHHV